MTTIVTALDVLRLAADIIATSSEDNAWVGAIANAALTLGVEGCAPHNHAVDAARIRRDLDGDWIDTADKKLNAILRGIRELETQ